MRLKIAISKRFISQRKRFSQFSINFLDQPRIAHGFGIFLIAMDTHRIFPGTIWTTTELDQLLISIHYQNCQIIILKLTS